jgi:hypothetical protein
MTDIAVKTSQKTALFDRTRNIFIDISSVLKNCYFTETSNPSSAVVIGCLKEEDCNKFSYDAERLPFRPHARLTTCSNGGITPADANKHKSGQFGNMFTGLFCDDYRL